MSKLTLITIKWSPPKETGNHPITKYIIAIEGPEYFSSKTYHADTVPLIQYEHTFSDLKPNTTYKVRVYAFNKLGKGDEATQFYKTVLFRRQGNIILFSKAVTNCDTMHHFD